MPSGPQCYRKVLLGSGTDAESPGFAAVPQPGVNLHQPWNLTFVTGPELRQLRSDLGDAIGRPLTAADMATLCGLAPSNGGDTIRRWEISGPSGPAGELLRILAMASDRYPILENFNVFDRFDVPEKERPARREEFREQMRDEVRRRLAAS
jgi:hypothetical protein